jgi:endonuclease/exonuclease/phosphatase family metal-dependent hydrolase
LPVLTVLSINIWDLPITLPGTRRRLRRRRLLERLPAMDADLVLLQEAFRPSLRAALAEVMHGYHADALLGAKRRWGPITLDASGGLLTFTRWPVLGTRYEPSLAVRGMKLDERIGRKGVLWTVIDTPAGPVTIGNVHLYAGNGPVDARVRTAQTGRIVRGAARAAEPIIIAGDFNIARETEIPDRGRSAFDVLARAGFEEVADGTSAGLETMDPRRNRWARYAPWHRPARRLTHMFYRGAGVRPRGVPRVVLDDPPVSDHFGLLATFVCSSD